MNMNCSQESGKDSQEKKKNRIKSLLVAATDCEPLYIIRLLQVTNLLLFKSSGGLGLLLYVNYFALFFRLNCESDMPNKLS
jgi:hypothetical protein